MLNYKIRFHRLSKRFSYFFCSSSWVLLTYSEQIHHKSTTRWKSRKIVRIFWTISIYDQENVYWRTRPFIRLLDQFSIHSQYYFSLTFSFKKLGKTYNLTLEFYGKFSFETRKMFVEKLATCIRLMVKNSINFECQFFAFQTLSLKTINKVCTLHDSFE